MQRATHSSRIRTAVDSFSLIVCLIAAPAFAAAPGDAGNTATMDALARELQALRGQVESLRTELQVQRSADTASARMPGGGMMDDDMNEMAPMAGGAISSPQGGGMAMESEMPPIGGGTGASSAMGCDMCMGRMGSGAMGPGGGMPSALPGFPGASHLYHIGADGFFVNHHPQHILLSIEQQTELNRMKEQAWLQSATTGREIDAAEQRLYSLTGSDQPQQREIEALLRSIESLRTKQRLDYIRAVGEAARVLTDAQRQALLGTSAQATPPMQDM